MAELVEKQRVVVEGESDELSESDVSVEEETDPDNNNEESDVRSDKESDGDDEEEEEEVEKSKDDEEAGGSSENPNAGWADAMAKILGKKTPGNKSNILPKNKQLEKIKEKENNEWLEKKKQFDRKRTWESLCREKPDVVRDREHERNLQRTATRGVVQLFNALNKHQKNVGEKIKEVGGSERKKSKILSSVSKKDFIDVLRGTSVSHKATVKKEKGLDKVKEEKPTWSVLRDDFMMGASMKDWDKESDDGDDYWEGEADSVADIIDEDSSDYD